MLKITSFRYSGMNVYPITVIEMALLMASFDTGSLPCYDFFRKVMEHQDLGIRVEDRLGSWSQAEVIAITRNYPELIECK